jgi:predicted enzyme related to lactoylglutathione lyase
MDPVVHFEMPFEDRERMAKFYRAAFGWQTEMLGEEMGSYVLATTVETGEKGPKRPGAINGGFYPKRPDWPAQYPSIVIAVDDIGKAVAADRAPADWGAVVDRVFVTNSRMAMMDALMTARTDEEVRVYAGYAGWIEGQLEWEIGRGDWYLLPADEALIFRRDMTKLWPELFRKSREIIL